MVSSNQIFLGFKVERPFSLNSILFILYLETIFPFDVSTIDATIRNEQTDITISYFDEAGDPLPSPLPNPFLTKSQIITIKVENNNSTINPIILHNSPSGAIERVMYALLEKCAKDAKEGRKPMFPLWLAPTQVRIIPLKDEFLEFSQKLSDKLTAQNIRVDIDDRNESIGKRIRESEKEWIRYVLVIGEKEVGSTNLSVRDRTQSDVKDISFDNFVAEITKQNEDKPHSTLNLPPLLSKRPIIQV